MSTLKGLIRFKGDIVGFIAEINPTKAHHVTKQIFCTFGHTNKSMIRTEQS
jgi:hypothetical protein